jgi:hypothetical protein
MVPTPLALLSRNGFRTARTLSSSVEKCGTLDAIGLLGEVAAWNASPILHESKIYTFYTRLFGISTGTTETGFIIIVKVVGRTTGTIGKGAKMLAFSAGFGYWIIVLV